MTMTISRILHAGYVFECDGTAIAFDTVFENPFSGNCHAFPHVAFDDAAIRRLRFDAVFISHYHDDHCSLDSLNLLERATPIYLYCLYGELFDMIRALGFTEVHALEIGVSVQIGAFEVIPVEAFDADVDCIFHIKAGGLNVLNVVDAWIGDEVLEALGSNWDMVLWPFQTMREIDVLSPSRAQPAARTTPAEFLDQLRQLNPRYVVPSSCQFIQEPWSWYRTAYFPITYRQFALDVQAHVVRLDPSTAVTLSADGLTPAAPLPWVIPVGQQDVDYDYAPHPVSTAEIARRFPALSAEQAQQVIAYCSGGLQAKYREMELPDGSYFEQARIWRLTAYDHDGQPMDWTYRVEGDTIAPANGTAQWHTEVPLVKIYAAMALGETLSSMYMRINDRPFDDATEHALQSADLLDDPLIRCLFNEVFGAYQAAQLARLTSSGAPVQTLP